MGRGMDGKEQCCCGNGEERCQDADDAGNATDGIATALVVDEVILVGAAAVADEA